MKKLICINKAYKNLLQIGFVIALSGILFLTGCESTKIVPENIDPILIVSVHGNAYLPWSIPENEKTESDNNKGGTLNRLVNNILGKNDPEIQSVQSRIDTASILLQNSLNASGFTLVDSSKLTNVPVLKFTQFFLLDDNANEVAAEGFKSYVPNGTKRNREIAKETGAKSLLFAEFKFEKQKEQQGIINYIAYPVVTMKITIVDSNGKKLLEKEYKALSTKSVLYKNGKWDKDKLVSLYPDTIQSVINLFMLDINGDSSAVNYNAQQMINSEDVMSIEIPSGVIKTHSIDDASIYTEPEAEVTQE